MGGRLPGRQDIHPSPSARDDTRNFSHPCPDMRCSRRALGPLALGRQGLHAATHARTQHRAARATQQGTRRPLSGAPRGRPSLLVGLACGLRAAPQARPPSRAAGLAGRPSTRCGQQGRRTLGASTSSRTRPCARGSRRVLPQPLGPPVLRARARAPRLACAAHVPRGASARRRQGACAPPPPAAGVLQVAHLPSAVRQR